MAMEFTTKYSTAFTFEERKIIQEHFDLGRSLFFISKLVHKSSTAIKREIARNSCDGKYIAEEAHKIAMHRKMVRLEKAHDVIRKQNNIKDRMAALEALVKSLSEIVEEFLTKKQ